MFPIIFLITIIVYSQTDFNSQPITQEFNIISDHPRDFLVVNSNIEITLSPKTEQLNNQEFPNMDINTGPIQREFEQYDLDHDGILRKEELEQSFRAQTEEIIREMISSGDTDMSGTISLEEFIKLRTRHVDL